MDILLDDWFEDFEPPAFSVPFTRAPIDASSVFNNPRFQVGELPLTPEKPLTAADRAWIVERGTNPATTTPPPSFAAQRALDNHLSKFNFVVPGSQDQWQSYIMYKYFELSLDPDPKISKPALDALAKTSIVGLAVDRQEIAISNVTDEELNKRLNEALGRYASTVIEGQATPA